MYLFISFDVIIPEDVITSVVPAVRLHFPYIESVHDFLYRGGAIFRLRVKACVHVSCLEKPK